MRQTFLVELEWLAGDIPYSEGNLLEQLRTVFGREYDNEIYSVKEVLPKVEPLEMPVVPPEVWGSLLALRRRKTTILFLNDPTSPR